MNCKKKNHILRCDSKNTNDEKKFIALKRIVLLESGVKIHLSFKLTKFLNAFFVNNLTIYIITIIYK